MAAPDRLCWFFLARWRQQTLSRQFCGDRVNVALVAFFTDANQQNENDNFFLLDLIDDSIPLSDSPNASSPVQIVSQRLALFFRLFGKFVNAGCQDGLDPSVFDGIKRFFGGCRESDFVTSRFCHEQNS